MVQYLPMLANVVQSGIGAIQEGKQRRAMARERQKWNAENDALFNTDYYKDYTQTAEAQNAIRQQREAQKQAVQQEQNTAAVTGATPDAVNAAKERRNKAMTNVYSNIAAAGTAYKERAKDRYLARKQALQGMEYDNMATNAASSNNLLYNGLNSMGKTDWASLITGGNSTAQNKQSAGSSQTQFGFDTKTGIPYQNSNWYQNPNNKDWSKTSTYVNTKPW